MKLLSRSVGLFVLFTAALTSAQFLSVSDPADNTITTTSTSNSGGCSVAVRNDFSGFYPMLFTEEGDFYPYQESTTEDLTWDMHLANGHNVIVSCAPNYLRSFRDQKTAKLTCQNDKLIDSESGTEVQWKKATCELRPVEEIIVSGANAVEHCESGTHTGVVFGYVNPVTKKTLLLGKACYSVDKGHTEFVQMRLKPKTMAFEESALEVQPDNYFQRKQHPSGRYKIDLMKAWGEHNRDRAEASFHVTPQRFARPQSIHLHTLEKLGWNYAFSQDEHSVWPELQAQVMALVDKKAQLVDYYAGSHGVVKTAQGEELYLGKDKKFAVPEYLWLFVREGVQGVAFVVYNKLDMSVEEEKTFHDVCSNKCDQVQWLSSAFKSSYGKYIVCCDVNDARANIAEMPLVTGITHSWLY